MENTHLHPLKSIKDCILFSSRDYSVSRSDAWIYGIVVGWSKRALKELAKEHNWSDESVEKLIRLNKTFKALEKFEKEKIPAKRVKNS